LTPTNAFFPPSLVTRGLEVRLPEVAASFLNVNTGEDLPLLAVFSTAGLLLSARKKLSPHSGRPPPPDFLLTCRNSDVEFLVESADGKPEMS